MTDFLDTIKTLEGTSLLDDGLASAEFSGWIDTGSYILNAQLSASLYGGIPDNRVFSIAGPEATGKTFFALGLVCQFLQDNADGVVVYFDTESAITKKMFASRGIDPKRVIASEPVTVQEFRTRALAIVKKYEESSKKVPMMFVLDSLGQLSTTKEVEDTQAGSETKDMTRTQVIKSTFRVLGLRLAKAGIPMIVTNHVYTPMGSMYPTPEMSGGSGVKYFSSTILLLSKAQDKDSKTNSVVGSIIRCKTDKNRFARERSVVKVRLSYTKGLDRYYGLVDLAIKHGIWQKTAKHVDTGVGKFFESKIYANPEQHFTEEIMEKLEVAAKEEYAYGEYLIEVEEENDA